MKLKNSQADSKYLVKKKLGNRISKISSTILSKTMENKETMLVCAKTWLKLFTIFSAISFETDAVSENGKKVMKKKL